MAPQTRKYLRFAIAISVMLLGIVYLAATADKENYAYYVTIPEMRAQASSGDGVYKKRLRVAGNVLPGSIKRRGTRVEFVLKELDHTLPVIYQGTEAPPDTFKDDSQALVEGSLGRDGVFQAKHLQAKCASKYDAAQNGKATASQGSAPAYSTSVKPSQ
jgi:cytochrome c-type biogenesis protein CcmE